MIIYLYLSYLSTDKSKRRFVFRKKLSKVKNELKIAVEQLPIFVIGDQETLLAECMEGNFPWKQLITKDTSSISSNEFLLRMISIYALRFQSGYCFLYFQLLISDLQLMLTCDGRDAVRRNTYWKGI